MQPRLFDLFGTPLPSYFALLLIGFLFATLGGALWARRMGENPDLVVDLGLSMLVFGVLGARLLHVFADGYFLDYVHLCTKPELVEWKIAKAECLRQVEPGWFGGEAGPTGLWDAARGVCRPREADCFAWARFWAGGLTYYGGFVGASIAAWFLLRADRFPFWKAADMAGMMVPLGLAFGRMGCVLGGCCFGHPWESPLAISFPAMSAASVAQAKEGLLSAEVLRSLPVHPTQLYEAFGALGLSAALVVLVHPKKRYDGQVFLAFIAGYALLRFVIEYFRADDRGGIGAFSTSQWIGLLLAAIAAVAHRVLAGRAEREDSRRESVV